MQIQSALLCAAAAGFGVGLLRLLARFQKTQRRLFRMPYQSARALFTPAERSFLGVLNQAVGQHYAIFGKVRLADIVEPNAGLPPARRCVALNRVAMKHVDFVLCDRGELNVIAVVELDDQSHRSERGQKRDAFVDAALGSAGVPIIHICAQRSYVPAEIQQAITEVIARVEATSPGHAQGAPQAPSMRGHVLAADSAARTP